MKFQKYGRNMCTAMVEAMAVPEGRLHYLLQDILQRYKEEERPGVAMAMAVAVVCDLAENMLNQVPQDTALLGFQKEFATTVAGYMLAGCEVDVGEYEALCKKVSDAAFECSDELFGLPPHLQAVVDEADKAIDNARQPLH